MERVESNALESCSVEFYSFSERQGTARAKFKIHYSLNFIFQLHGREGTVYFLFKLSFALSYRSRDNPQEKFAFSMGWFHPFKVEFGNKNYGTLGLAYFNYTRSSIIF